MQFYGKRLLFIGAHPDDIELGCGALIARISGITEVFCVTLSDNQNNPLLTNLVNEHYKSMTVLGITPERIKLGGFTTRRFMENRQEILEHLIALHKEVNPDIVFVHTPNDLHQDHVTVTNEALRAFRGTTLLGFDVLRSSYGFFPHFLVEVDESNVNKKIAALAEYKTYADKYYFREEITRATLIRHGALAGKPFAEGFDILRVIGTFLQ